MPYGAVITQIGQNKIATAHATQTPINLAVGVVGDANGVSVPIGDVIESKTALVHQVHSVALNTVFVDPNNAANLIAEFILPAGVGGWTIREVGIKDQAGDLIAYGNYPDRFKPVVVDGSISDLTIQIHMPVEHTDAITLQIDPNIVTASRDYVDDAVAAEASARQSADTNLNNLLGNYLPMAGAAAAMTGRFRLSGDGIESMNPVSLQQLTTGLSGKSDTSHLHDDRYYTETELQNGTAQVHFGNLTNLPATVAGHGISDAITTAGGQTINGNLKLLNNAGVSLTIQSGPPDPHLFFVGTVDTSYIALGRDNINADFAITQISGGFEISECSFNNNGRIYTSGNAGYGFLDERFTRRGVYTAGVGSIVLTFSVYASGVSPGHGYAMSATVAGSEWSLPGSYLVVGRGETRDYINQLVVNYLLERTA